MNNEEKLQVVKYSSLLKAMLDNADINGMSVGSLIAISLEREEGELIEPDLEKRTLIALKTVQTIKDGKEPFLKYDAKQDIIRKVDISALLNGEQKRN